MSIVVYTKWYSRFGLSDAATKKGVELSGDTDWGKDYRGMPRHDKVLVEVVESLRVDPSAKFANLQVATVEGTHYFIDEYDGYESVLTPTNIDWVVVK